MEPRARSAQQFAGRNSGWPQENLDKPSKFNWLQERNEVTQIGDFDVSDQQLFFVAIYSHEKRPYESIIGDIETLYFTTSSHPTSIHSLGTSLFTPLQL